MKEDLEEVRSGSRGGAGGNFFLLKKQQLCPEWEHARTLGIFLRDTLSPAGHYQIFFITVLPQFMIVYIFLR